MRRQENPFIESFNGKLRDELLNVGAFETLLEAKVLAEDFRIDYNTYRPHSSLGYRSPVFFAAEWARTIGRSHMRGGTGIEVRSPHFADSRRLALVHQRG